MINKRDIKMAAESTNIRRSSEVWKNGKVNGVECKTPFLIGVAGGTASGKVRLELFFSPKF